MAAAAAHRPGKTENRRGPGNRRRLNQTAPPKAAAATHKRMATMAAAGRATLLTIRGMVPQPVHTTANARYERADADTTSGYCRPPATLREKCPQAPVG